jgi:PKD repeat protein
MAGSPATKPGKVGVMQMSLCGTGYLGIKRSALRGWSVSVLMVVWAAGGLWGSVQDAWAACDPGIEVAVRADILAGKAPLTVQVRGGVIGEDAGSAQVRWDFDDGGVAGNDLTVSHVYAQAGNYLVLFEAEVPGTDCPASTHVFILVNEDTNETPTARVSAAFGEGDAPVSVVFTSLSEDGDGRIVLHEWSFGDGEFGTGEVVVHNYARNGTYLVRLTVTDDRGGKDFTIRSIDIGAGVSGLGSGLSTSQPNPTNTSRIGLGTCGAVSTATLSLTVMALLALRLTGTRRRR